MSLPVRDRLRLVAAPAAAAPVVEAGTVRTEPGMFEIADSFRMTQHRTLYRVLAEVGGSSRGSQIIRSANAPG